MEASALATGLQELGYDVTILAPRGAAELRSLDNAPPQAVVIDLSRLPSQGMAVGIELRRRKATRTVPLLFVGGEPGKVARIRALLPDALYCGPGGIAAALASALRVASAGPVVPDTMAGYSGVPLPRKLGIRAGTAVALVSAPQGLDRRLGPLPDGARILRGGRGTADLILVFARSLAELRESFAPASRRLSERGAIWMIWPKKASGMATDLGQRQVREFGMAEGFVDYKVCAIDETWSGLLFTRRRARTGRSIRA